MLDSIKNNININVSSSSLVEAGMSQETYKIENHNNEEYFLKYTTDPKNQKRMYQCHIHQLNFLPDQIKKPKLIESDFRSEYAYIIQKYHDSINSYNFWDENSFLLNTAENLGNVVQLLQDSNDKNRIKYRYDVEKMVYDATKYTRKSGYDSYISIIEDAKNQLNQSNEKQVFAHRDLHLDNLLLNSNGFIKYIVDWEHCRWTHPMYDLAKIEVRFLDKFHNTGINDSSILRDRLRSTYGMDKINYKELYAIKILHGLRTIGRIRTKNEAYYPWSQIMSREKIERQYEKNIDRYIDKFYERSSI